MLCSQADGGQSSKADLPFAASAFEKEAYCGTLKEAIARCWKGGAFAVGLLLLSTQLATAVSLLAQGIDPIGASQEADVAALRGVYEVLIDVVVQASSLTAFRVFRWADAQPRR